MITLDLPFAVRGDGEKLTDYDTPEVIEARKRAYAIERTDKISTFARRRMRREIAEKLYGRGAERQERVAVLVLGPPGAGKSAVISAPAAKEIGGLIIDSDDAKFELPEYQGGIGAMATHAESAEIADMVLQRAIEAGDNIVLPRVGSSMASVVGHDSLLREAGYQVHVVHLDLSVDETVQRVLRRFKETGRFVDPDYVVNVVGSNTRYVYNALKEGGLHASYSHYSNAVSEGELPIAIESFGPSPAIPSQAEVEVRGDRGRDGEAGNEQAAEDAQGLEEEGRDQGLSFALRDDDRAISLLDRLPDPPAPSRPLRKFFERNSTEGMFDGINPNPRVGFSLMLDHMRRMIQDKFLPVLRVQEVVEAAGGRISPEANAYRAETLYYGKAAEAKRRYDKWVVEPLLAKMKDAGIERGELDLYL